MSEWAKIKTHGRPWFIRHWADLSKLCSSGLSILWTIAHQASLSVGFSRLGYWSGLPFPSPGDLPNPGIEPMSPVAPAL